ncbi:fatty acid desaturase [Hoeflea sp.]|uniref:fatty acid desaturase n=1 Tax=Hoeflea sp. TaxID=1940281 RepID=UPI003B021491
MNAPHTFAATNAASTGVTVDRKRLKALARRSDRPGVIFLAKWLFALALSGFAIWLALGTFWVWPAMLLHGVVLCVPAYALSHETAHGTAFRTRWLNEAVLWVTSFIYIEEPLHRRYTHTNHHTFTWHAGKDSQMPFATPMDFWGWLQEVSGFGLARFHVTALLRLSAARYTPVMRDVIPETELPKLTRNARIFLLLYLALAGLIAAGVSWPLWFLVLPRILGAPAMLLFTLIQHVEMQENSPSIVESTRSFATSWIGRFLYMNMNNHIEHHLYPQVPFHALPELHEELKGQLPEPDPGFWRTNVEVLSVVLRRSLGRNTKARSIRQAPHMIGEGRFERVAERTM